MTPWHVNRTLSDSTVIIVLTLLLVGKLALLLSHPGSGILSQNSTSVLPMKRNIQQIWLYYQIRVIDWRWYATKHDCTGRWLCLFVCQLPTAMAKSGLFMRVNLQKDQRHNRWNDFISTWADKPDRARRMGDFCFCHGELWADAGHKLSVWDNCVW